MFEPLGLRGHSVYSGLVCSVELQGYGDKICRTDFSLQYDVVYLTRCCSKEV